MAAGAGWPATGHPTVATVVPQRLVLVLPSTAEFDSRTFRIASAAVARGHEVTVLARWRPGLATDEVHPSGYRIRRVPVSARAGIPLLGRRVRRAAGAAGPRGAAGPTAPAGQQPSAAATDAAPAAPRGSSGAGAGPGPGSPAVASMPRRFISSLTGRFAIPLTIRAQRLATIPLAPPADLYHGMAYMGVPIALDLARRHHGHVVYDARDIYVDAANLARSPRWLRWLVGRAERGWARRVDRVVTVNRPYAEVMAERWGVELPAIVLNCSYRFEPPDPPERRFHEALGLAPEQRVVVYHGGLSPDRGIEQLLEAIAAVPGAVLVLVGYGRLEERLRAAAADPASGGRIRLMPAVPPEDLLGWLASADVVAMPIQPTTLNHRLTTPNKLFEAMAAGVPVVASDLPGMATIVRDTGCGILVDPTDAEAIAAAIRRILEAPPDEMAAWRRRCLEAAHATYSWESQLDVLLAEYGRITGRPW